MSSIDDNLNIILAEDKINIVKNNLDKNGKLSCLKAFKVAKLLKVDPCEISAITKNIGVKITDCELGVFGNIEFAKMNSDIYEALQKKYHNLSKIECKSLWEDAKKWSLRDVGSVAKNGGFEVSYCQLGCFRERKGHKV